MFMVSSYGLGNSDISLADNANSDNNVLATEEAMDDSNLDEVCESHNGIVHEENKLHQSHYMLLLCMLY